MIPNTEPNAEKTVTLTKEEFLEKSAEATSAVIDKLSKGADDAKFTAMVIMIGAVFASEQASLIFGESKETENKEKQ